MTTDQQMKQFLKKEANKRTREITEQNSKIPPQISVIRNIHVRAVSSET